MANEKKQLINLVTELKENINKRFDDMDKRFNIIDKRFNDIETAIKELNSTQIKILNSIELLEKDIESNTIHIERLEKKDHFV